MLICPACAIAITGPVQAPSIRSKARASNRPLASLVTTRTRFAPSPTGYLHIGGVRTALFNWLFARRHGGQFLLRIDDTDAERNVESALAPILHGFRWLGIDWNEGPEVDGPYAPYYQSQRLAGYQQAAETLLAGGFMFPVAAAAAVEFRSPPCLPTSPGSLMLKAAFRL